MWDIQEGTNKKVLSNDGIEYKIMLSQFYIPLIILCCFISARQQLEIGLSKVQHNHEIYNTYDCKILRVQLPLGSYACIPLTV